MRISWERYLQDSIYCNSWGIPTACRPNILPALKGSYVHMVTFRNRSTAHGGKFFSQVNCTWRKTQVKLALPHFSSHFFISESCLNGHCLLSAHKNGVMKKKIEYFWKIIQRVQRRFHLLFTKYETHQSKYHLRIPSLIFVAGYHYHEQYCHLGLFCPKQGFL